MALGVEDNGSGVVVGLCARVSEVAGKRCESERAAGISDLAGEARGTGVP